MRKIGFNDAARMHFSCTATLCRRVAHGLQQDGTDEPPARLPPCGAAGIVAALRVKSGGTALKVVENEIAACSRICSERQSAYQRRDLQALREHNVRAVAQAARVREAISAACC